MGFNSRLFATCGLATRREPSLECCAKSGKLSSSRARIDDKILRSRGLFCALACRARSLKPQMKADFDSWRACENMRLDFCAPSFPNVVSRRPRVLHSRLAHPAATKIPSKAQSKRAQRPQAAQFPHLLGSYGAPGPVKAQVSRVDGVKLTGFNEFIARKLS